MGASCSPTQRLHPCPLAPSSTGRALPANGCALLLVSSSSKNVWETRVEALDERGRVGKSGLPVTLDYLCPPWPAPPPLSWRMEEQAGLSSTGSHPEDWSESLASTGLGFPAWQLPLREGVQRLRAPLATTAAVGVMRREEPVLREWFHY